MNLTASVGKMGQNKIHDVAVVQAALMNLKGGPGGKGFWKGPIDGKPSKALTDAIAAFQSANRVTPANGTIQSIGPTLSKLRGALPMGIRYMTALEKTAIVYVPVMGEREAEKQAAETIKRAPFPNREAKSIAFVQKVTGKKAGLALTRSRDFIGSDGCFATELDFVGVKWIDARTGKPMLPGREPAAVASFIWKQFPNATIWRRGSQNDLLFKSTLQLQSLKNRPPLTQKHLAALGLMAPPQNEVLKALVVACARLITGEVKPAKKHGQPEHILILQAAEGVDKKVADAMRKAVAEFDKSKGVDQVPRGPGAIFSSIDEAAIDGLLTASRLNRSLRDNRERGGDILEEDGGGYSYNNLQEGPPTGGSVQVKGTESTVAWFHTHPPLSPRADSASDKKNRDFSGIDDVATGELEEAAGQEIFVYLGGTDGSIKKKGPGVARGGITLREPNFLKYKNYSLVSHM